MKAVVLDGQLQSSLAIVRSLGAKGVSVFCGAERKMAMSLFSRYVDETFVYPSPLQNPQGFLKFFQEFSQAHFTKHEPGLIFAQSDNTFLPLSKHIESLRPRLQMVVPDSASKDIAFDKNQILHLAEEMEVPYPKTMVIRTSEELLAFAQQASFPLVVKPPSSALWNGGQGVFGTATIVKNIVDLEQQWKRCLGESGIPPLVQEYIPGQEYGIFFLLDQGEVKAKFAHRRLRSIHPTGGASCFRESIVLPEDMYEYSLRLLKRLKWHGVAMVEFKRDSRDQKPKLMEINGRFWGSLPLAVSAGVDFPFLFFQMAQGILNEPIPSYRVGIQGRHLLADLKHFMQVCLGKGKVEGIDYPKKGETLKNFFHFFGKDLYYDVLSWKDPLPFGMEIVDTVKKFFSHL